MGVLKGFKRAVGGGVGGLAIADHTYVTSDQNDRWPCWGLGAGGSSGGTEICSGSGSIPRARCLAQPSGHAAILWGVTGVCHQTANRILLPSGRIVAAAAGFWASALAYGIYGRDAVFWFGWLGPVSICDLIIPPFKKKVSAGKRPAAKRNRADADGSEALVAEVLALYALGLAHRRRPDLNVLADKETDLLLDHLAPKPLTRGVKSKIIALRHRSDGRLRTLAGRVYAGKTDGEGFAADGNAAISDLFRQVARVLGADAYTEMFGYSPRVDVTVIDPEEAMTQTGALSKNG